MRNNLYNIFYCVIIPSSVAGITSVGFFFLGSQMSLGVYPIAFIVFLSGIGSYSVGYLIRSVFKWKKETKPSLLTGVKR